MWDLTPKLATNGWWFAHWWNGPGSKRWTATPDGVPPASAAWFRDLASAVAALEADGRRALTRAKTA
jgi:hypothetical protein